MLTMLLTVSLTIPYLGPERFGIWMTIASFAGMLSFLDLGVGNALTNRVAHVASSGDQAELRQTISSGVRVLFLVGLLASTVMTISATLVPWNKLIKVDNLELYEEIRLTGVYFGGLFGLHLVVGGIQRVFHGLQRAFTAHMVTTLGSILSLLAIWTATQAETGIPGLLLSSFGVQLTTSSLLLIILIKNNLLGNTRSLTKLLNDGKYLFQSGGLFFLLQISTMVGWGADSLIIANRIGVADVAIFAITQRVFQFASQPLAILNAPLWGAYADANARNDVNYIMHTLKKSVIGTAATGIFLSCLVLAISENLIAAWTSNTVSAPRPLLVAFAVWTFVEATGSAFSIFLNGCNILKPQIILTFFLIAAAIPLKLAAVVSFGTTGMVTSYICIYLLVHFILYGIIFREKIFGGLKKHE